jgi:hypothetical protein
MALKCFTHDRIDLAAGLLARPTLLYGANALQSITITRNTPRQGQQAIGSLGIVDYTRGIVTSDVTLDAIVIEAGSLAAIPVDPEVDPSSAINKYAGVDVDLATEAYAMQAFSFGAQAGQPTTASYGWLTAGMASYLINKAQPAASDGTQVQVVLGDEGAGLSLVATWAGGHTAGTDTVAILDASGNPATTGDSGLPSGVQSVNVSGNINRDQILDVRSSRPQKFVTTYPVGMTLDLEVYSLPGTAAQLSAGTLPWSPSVLPAWDKLTELAIVQRTTLTNVYCKIKGLAKQTEGESVAVGRYLAYTVSFEGSEIFMPIAGIAP